MSHFEERDSLTAAMIREEIEKLKADVERCGWKQPRAAWYKAFGEMTGMYRILG